MASSERDGATTEHQLPGMRPASDPAADAIIDTAAAMIVVLDRTGRVLRVNRACESATGWSSDELRTSDQPFWEILVRPSDRTHVRDTFEAFASSSEDHPRRLLNGWVAKDGRTLQVDWTSTCLRNERGEVEFVVACGIDVTEQRSLYEALERSQRHVEDLVNTVDGIVWESDARTADFPAGVIHFTMVSPQAERILGFPVESWLEPTFWADHIHPADRSRVLEFCQRKTEERHAHHTMEYRMRKASGSWVWLRDIVTVINGDDGPVALRGIMVDITDRKELEAERDELFRLESEARERAEAAERRWEFLAEASRRLSQSLDYRATLDAVAHLAVPTLADWCAVFLVDAGQLQEAAIAHRDQAEEEALAELFTSAESAEAKLGLSQALESGQSWIGSRAEEKFAWTESREKASESLMVVPLTTDGTKLGALAFGITAAERRFTPDDLDLAREVARRCVIAIENAHLYRKAQEAIRVRDDFLSIASHELRTPLTPLALRLQRLERALLESGVGDAAVVKKTRRSVQQLTALVNDLLDASRIAGGRLPLDREPVSLRAVVEEAVGDMRSPEYPMHPIALSLPNDDVCVCGDRARLEQVVSNLLENAVKYSPSGGEIEVVLTVRDGRTELTVKDRGIGIPAGERERLFERFYRARNVSAQSYAGLGLGLYICREIVERHEGRIWVESELGGGSTFHVELPLLETSRRPNAPPDERQQRV